MKLKFGDPRSIAIGRKFADIWKKPARSEVLEAVVALAIREGADVQFTSEDISAESGFERSRKSVAKFLLHLESDLMVRRVDEDAKTKEITWVPGPSLIAAHEKSAFGKGAPRKPEQQEIR